MGSKTTTQSKTMEPVQSDKSVKLKKRKQEVKEETEITDDEKGPEVEDAVEEKKGKKKKVEEKESCHVCQEPYNKLKLKKVMCCKCKYAACRACYERYFLQNIGEPHCMSCRDLWGYSVLFQNFTKVFVKDVWNPHRARVLIEHEKSLLSDTMEYVQAQRDYERARFALSTAERKFRQAEDDYYYIQTAENLEKRQKALEEYNKQTREHRRMEEAAPLHRARYMFMVDRNVADPLVNANIKKVDKKKKTFTWPCPQENCKGFLDDKYVCGLCDVRLCKKCHGRLEKHQEQVEDDEDEKVVVNESDFKTAVEAQKAAAAESKNNVEDVKAAIEEDMKEDEKTESKKKHKCKKADVETMKELKKSTRQCPRCPALIYRISGCAQVWCTQCFTAFDYVTGEIATGRIHNPHYFEYVQKHGAPPPGAEQKGQQMPRHNQQDVCGLPNILQLSNFCHRNRIAVPILEMYREVDHIENITMAELRRTRDMVRTANHPLVMRINFMLNRITEDEWRQQLSLNDRSRIWAHEALQIYFTWCQSMKERLRNLIPNPNDMSKPEIINSLREIIEFTKLSNQSLHQVALCYNTSLHYVTVGTVAKDPFHPDLADVVRQINHYMYPVKVLRMKNVVKPKLSDIQLFN